jgi:formate dehydrogenase subunit gamma
MGSDGLIRHIQSRLDVGLGETTADGSITFEQAFCLGLCAMSPALMLDGKPYGRVTPQIADTLIDGARRQA